MTRIVIWMIVALAAAPARADIRPWQLGARAGVEVPRGELDAGPVIGAVGHYTLDGARALSLQLAIDWTRLGRRAATLLSPPAFPRSLGELDQRSDLITIAAGAEIGVADVGTMTITVGAAAGLQLSRTRFEAYVMEEVRTRVAPAVTVEAALQGPAGPLHWRATVAWRESRAAGRAAYGEDVSSGLLAMLGVDW